MRSKTITIRLPADMLKIIDEAAKANYNSRSNFIRESIVLRLNGQRVINERSAVDL